MSVSSDKMLADSVLGLLLIVLLSCAAGCPMHHESEPRSPLGAVSELTSRLAARTSRLQSESRLPLPTPQDLETIKKVAQILIMLGEQVLPSAVGEPAHYNTTAADPPNDAVNFN